MDAPLMGRDVRLADLFERIPDALLVLDERGTIADANPAAVRLFAAPAQALVGRTARDLVDDPQTLEGAVAELTEAQGGRHGRRPRSAPRRHDGPAVRDRLPRPLGRSPGRLRPRPSPR